MSIHVIPASLASALIEYECPACGQHKSMRVEVSASRINEWKNQGVFAPLIQHALPELTPGQREVLLSQICEPCFDKAFDKNAFAEEAFDGDDDREALASAGLGTDEDYGGER